VHLKERRSLLAFASLDETRIAEAYLDGSIDFEGSLLAALRLRPILSDRHPLAWLWKMWLVPFLVSQTRADTQWISEHYDEDPEFFGLLLGPTYCYSHAHFESDDEPLEKAMARKFDCALEACRLRPGQRVLDIGGGWGAFSRYAGERGIRVTSLTISEPSERFIQDLIQTENLPCEVVRRHLLDYESPEPFDAIVNMGVTEHLPDYRATLACYERLLVPGGRIYLDASSGTARYGNTSFIFKHIFPGNASTLCLHDYVEEVRRTPFELVSLHNDRRSYELTALHWARNLERHRDAIVERWGERLYRKFRLFLWGCVYSFGTRQLSAYHWVLELPEEQHLNKRLDGGDF
jgi:cyclopropane-fatty-acyl-phospholipid synthase